MLKRFLKRHAWSYRAWQRVKRSGVLELLRPSPTSQRALRSHARAALVADASYAGEAAHLRGVLAACGIDRGFVVDLAAGDGVEQSSTLFLFRNPDWRGLAIEMDPVRFKRLAFAYGAFPGARLEQAKVTPDSVVPLFQQMNVPEAFDVLNLDIDSYDYSVAEALLGSYRPAVVSMEINEKIPPPIHFTVLYDAGHTWAGDHFYGCSIVAASELLKSKGYVLQSLRYNNAFFLRADLAQGRFRDIPVEEAYEEGYRRRPDRRELFPWNHDVEDLLHASPDTALDLLRRKFSQYEGRFVARISENRHAHRITAD